MIPVKTGSNEKIGGYYVFFMLRKSLDLDVPYCPQCFSKTLEGDVYKSVWIEYFNSNSITISFKHKEYAEAFRQANGIG
jgi:hypothetical protein